MFFVKKYKIRKVPNFDYLPRDLMNGLMRILACARCAHVFGEPIMINRNEIPLRRAISISPISFTKHTRDFSQEPEKV